MTSCAVVLLDPLAECLVPAAGHTAGFPFNYADGGRIETEVGGNLLPVSSKRATLHDHHVPVSFTYRVHR